MDNDIAYDRRHVRAIIEEITGIDPYTEFAVDQGQLRARAPWGLSERQKELLAMNKHAIVWYLTTPPAMGMCRRGHRIEWTISRYGVWLCSCYHAPAKQETAVIASKLAEHVTVLPGERQDRERKRGANYAE